MPLLRSNVEFAKRVFLDRLTTDAQGLLQPDPGDIDEGPGDEYEYGNCYDPYNFGIGADCSGSSGIFIGAAVNGTAMHWGRLFTTEDFPGPFTGFRQTNVDDLMNNYYPIKVSIGRHGGGAESHMHINLDGIVMESNGDNGTCTLGHGAMTDNDPYWNTYFVYDDGGITEDTAYREPMTYVQGVDYSAGAIDPNLLKAANKEFVCRYTTPAPATAWKCLQPQEFADLVGAGIDVVFNYEGTANQMVNGHDQGVADATESLNYIRSLPGVPNGYQPVVYFSCDFDEPPQDDAPIFDYLRGAASVLGGVQYVGIYGAYWVCKRALDAGVATFMWQTEAWSGGNIDSRVHIMQRNNAGYATIGGIQCDKNEAHADYFGQFSAGGADMPESTAELILDQLAGEPLPDGSRGWPQLGNRSIVDYLAQVVGPGLQQINATLAAIQTTPPATPPTPAAQPPKKKKGWL